MFSGQPRPLHDEVTTMDHALRRPWTVINRVRNPVWVEAICAEGNQHVRIGAVSYMISADGHLMPAKKGRRHRICGISTRAESDL